MANKPEGYQASEEEVSLAEESMSDYQRRLSEKREAFTEQGAQKGIDSILAGLKHNYDDRDLGRVKKEFEKQLQLISHSVPEFEQLGAKVWVAGSGQHHGATEVSVEIDGHFYPLYDQFYDTYSTFSGGNDRGAADMYFRAMSDALNDKIELLKQFAKNNVKK